MLRDRGLLQRTGETWRLDRADVEVPETVQGIIAARLDALEADEKALLQAASVVGKVFWLGSAAAIAEVSSWEAEELLHALERKEFVRRDRRASVAGETEYAVRHVLVRDVAYGQIPRVRRADLHVRAAAWIESLGEDRAADRAEMLAHHYAAALELTRAAGGDASPLEAPARRALREAGNRAYALSALESSVRFHSRARELWPETDPEYPHLLLELGRALAWLRAEGGPELRQASELLLAIGDVEAAADAEAAAADVCRANGQQHAARAHVDRAAELIVGLPETRVTARIRAFNWRFAVLTGADLSLDEGRRILALTEELGTTEEELGIRITFGLALASTGHIHEAIRHTEQTRQIALEAKSHLAARATSNLASMLGTAGDLRRSAQVHREGLQFARSVGSRLEHWLTAECALDDYIAGDWDAAIVGATTYLEQRGASRYMDAAAHSVLAATAEARGKQAAAVEHARAMLERAREAGEPQTLYGSLGESARLALEGGGRVQAESLVEELATALSGAMRFEVDLMLVAGFVTAAALGRGDELGAQLGKVAYDSPWARACAHIAAGRYDEAGDELHAHDAFAYAALVRLHGAEVAGRETPGLRDAAAFYEGVGATAHLARAERLLQASA